MNWRRWLLADSERGTLGDVGLLFLRLGAGLGLALAHGWSKAAGYAERASSFADPLGIGSESSLALAVFGEVVCGLALAVGLLTRLSAVPFSITMGVAAFIHHAADPFGSKEKALLYMVMGLTLVFTGPGRFSLDALLFGRTGAAAPKSS